ncbi:Pyridoxal 5'-phosphate (PLP)-binding protein [Fragilaria crotonensis]|nr:Pyridoxal 5'-phosphate (PLP)-binding protein [Fragilaria crotonensis]
MNIIQFCVQLWLMPSCVAALFLTTNRSWAPVASRPFLLSRTLIPVRACASSPSSPRIRTSFSSLAMTEATTVDVALNLQDVRNRIHIATDKATAAASLTTPPAQEVQLVAVSKTKPLELLMAAYDQGNQRLFGENYVQELIDKAQLMPSDVQWHFIGTLQSNKVNGLIKAVVPKAASLTVETVSTLKLAKKLDTAMQTLKTDASSTAAVADPNIPQLLPIFVQVNTSGEDTKGGVEPDQVVALCQETLPHLVNISS